MTKIEIFGYLRDMKLSRLLCLLFIMLFMSGCVTSKMYRSVKAELLGFQAAYTSMEAEVDSLRHAATTSQPLSVSNNNDAVAELENLLAQREAALFEINQTIEDALSGFNGRGLSVTKRNGRVYVSMNEKLLFESGKSELSEQGIRAVHQIADVLERNPSISITVEGHTDNAGYIAKPDAQIVDNWDLSCKRATEVIRILLQDSDIRPARIIASGRAQYIPIKQGNSPEVRAVNRRVEVILTPNIDKILEALNQIK